MVVMPEWLMGNKLIPTNDSDKNLTEQTRPSDGFFLSVITPIRHYELKIQAIPTYSEKHGI